jgi:hypothetical protein
LPLYTKLYIITIIPKVIAPRINIENADVNKNPKIVAKIIKRVIAFSFAGGSIVFDGQIS